MSTVTENELLAMWESGLRLGPVERAVTLAAAWSQQDPADVADLMLGDRDTLLFALREQCFGRQLHCSVDCPECEEQLEITLDSTELRAGLAPDQAWQTTLDGLTVYWHPVTSADLLRLDLNGPDPRVRLIQNCLQAPVAPLSQALVDAVSADLAAADPQADAVLALDCAACQHEWLAPFDIGGYLWLEIDGYARRVMYEVHTLALAYGWSEAEVLAVSPVRRGLYLEAVPS